MTRKYRRMPPNARVPVYRVDETRANEAYAAYSAIQKMAQAEPSLLENEFFTALQDTAYARFLALFEALP